LKENHANDIAIRQKTRTRSQVAADQGNDIEEIFQQMVFEEELAKKYGLNLEPTPVIQRERSDRRDPEKPSKRKKKMDGHVAQERSSP
jgi:capsid protein